MRNLASIQRIKNLEPIPNADSIEKATVLGWELVTKKGEFQIGDLCVYCEIDSLLPERPEFEFLRERKFRIRTIKLRGQVSQGICFPLSVLPEGTFIEEGKDVTELLGITKYEPYVEEEEAKGERTYKSIYPRWMPKWMKRFAFIRNYYKKRSFSGKFPEFLTKTDETRVQVLQPLLDKYKGLSCYVTEKLDGSSITIFWYKNKMGVCSRNLNLKRNKTDKYWKAVLSYDLENKLKNSFKNHNFALQGELIGPGIQGNKYKLQKHEIHFFNLFDINAEEYKDFHSLSYICEKLDVPMVPVVRYSFDLINSIPDLVEMSKGKSKLANVHREGIVIRPYQEIEDHELRPETPRNRVSFKVVNPDFLLKYEE